MSNNFMSPLPTFTLEALMADGRWMAAQNTSRKKSDSKSSGDKKATRSSDRSATTPKSAA
jgi:hypothetical protein